MSELHIQRADRDFVTVSLETAEAHRNSAFNIKANLKTQ